MVSTGRPVTPAMVTMGMPMAPKAVGTVLATRQITAANMGWKPMAARMLAGMATAVPYPATPSRKPPKPQATMSTSRRLSVVMDESMRVITSMLPVWRARL